MLTIIRNGHFHTGITGGLEADGALLFVPLSDERGAEDGFACAVVTITEDAFGCSAKNDQMRSVAEISRFTAPANRSGSSGPPGQVWPPPSIA